MAESKDKWDKIASITPLILGIAVTAIGAIFTHIYNFRQLQLNQINALEKLRPLLTSDKAEDREFGYASFAALGYEEIAIRIIQLKKDESGRSVLVELKKAGQPKVRVSASNALNTLDEAKILVNVAEFGKAEADESMLNKYPDLQDILLKGEEWAQKTAHDIGISSKLGVAILYDTAVHRGISRAQKLQKITSASISPPLNSREKEATWLNEYLDQRDKTLQQGVAAKFYPVNKKRIDRLRNLIRAGDWDLQSVATPNNKLQ